MQIGGCLPGHFARAHGGGNSSNSLSKDLDRVRRHWQGPCWVAVVVVDAEVWELKLPRLLMAGYSWEGCPAAGGLYGCCRCARARVRRRAMPRAPACDKLRCERHFGVGLCRPNRRPAGSESSFEVAGAEDSSGRGFRSGGLERLPHRPRARPPSAPTTLLRLKQTEQHVVICTSERAKQRSVGRSALHNKCFPPAAVTTLQ